MRIEPQTEDMSAVEAGDGVFWEWNDWVGSCLVERGNTAGSRCHLGEVLIRVVGQVKIVALARIDLR